MLYRKIKLSTFGLYLKAVSKLWLVPLLTVNVLVPVISAVLYKNGGAGAESDIVTVMYFLLPISTVWTSIFVSEFFFSDRTRDVLFFYSRKKRFAVSQLLLSAAPGQCGGGDTAALSLPELLGEYGC